MADAAVETAPTDENDDNWLYGDSATEVVKEGEEATNEKPQEATNAAEETQQAGDKEDQEEAEGNEDSQFNDEHFENVDREDQDQTNGDVDSQDNGDSDSDDSDNVKVTIGEIKSGPQTYANLNVKRGVGLVTAGQGDKPRQPATSGKVNLEDLEGPGSINGVPALEFNIDTIEDKPWNKPGADISDYFNYGFNEVTWSAYCERQRRMRVAESGGAMHSGPRAAPAPDMRRPPVRMEESMPPPMANNYNSARENTIQVMTAERREYGRAHREGEYFAPPEHFYPPVAHPSHPPYDEPWGQRHPEQGGWAPSDIKELTPGSAVPGMGPPLPPPHPPHLPHMPPYRPPHAAPAPYPLPHAHPHPHPHTLPHPHAHPHPLPHPLDRDRDRDRDRERDRDRDRDRMRERDERDRRERDRRDEEERDRDRERSRSIKPDRIREKSYRRERSRSRSRRHKSRSRSPRPRERSRDRDRSDRDRERSLKPKNKESKDKDDEK